MLGYVPSMGTEAEDNANEARELIAANIRRVEEMLQFLPLPDATVKDLRSKISFLRTILLEQRAPALALMGRRGAGKSSLINSLFGAKVAEVGHVRAQTGRGRWFDHKSERGVISVLDTRGIQEGSVPREGDEAKDALASVAIELKRKLPDVILFLVKASEADSAIDADLDAIERIYAEVEREHKVRPPLVVLATHCDILEPKATRLHAAREEPPVDVEEKLARVLEVEHHLERKVKERSALAPHLVWTRGVSTYLSFAKDDSVRADERWRVDELVSTLFEQIPEAGRGTLVRIARIRSLQESVAKTLTRTTAALCAAVAALPIPVADLIPITTLQISLIAGIAWVSGRSLDRKAAAEFLTAMGANVGIGFAFREGARALIKFVFPGAGSMVSGAVAFAGTLAVGAAAQTYFLGGTMEDAKKAFEAAKKISEDDVASPDSRDPE